MQRREISDYFSAALIILANLETLRAAVLRWMQPFEAALSTVDCAIFKRISIS